MGLPPFQFFLSVWLVLVGVGILEETAVPKLHQYQKIVAAKTEVAPSAFELIYRYPVSQSSSFRMLEGFINFDCVQKNQLLAFDEQREVHVALAGAIAAPLMTSRVVRGAKRWLPLWGIVTPTSDHDFAGMCRALGVEGYDDPRIATVRRQLGDQWDSQIRRAATNRELPAADRARALMLMHLLAGWLPGSYRTAPACLSKLPVIVLPR